MPGWCPTDRLSADKEPGEAYGSWLPREILDRLPAGIRRMTIDLYDDEVLYTDYSIGLVLEKVKELGLWEETVIIVTADHGEDLNLHEMWGHGTLHNTTVQVPVIIRDPLQLPKGKRVPGLVQHVDNLPTILEYFPEQDRPDFERIALPSKMPEVPERFDGESLLALVRGERKPQEEIVVESMAHRAYVAPPWKLIWYKDGRESELFHMENDPLELNDRAQEEREVAGDLTDRLRAWVDRSLRGERTDPILAVKPGE